MHHPLVISQSIVEHYLLNAIVQQFSAIDARPSEIKY